MGFRSGAAENQPVTSIVGTLRNLYAEQPLGNGGWLALAWCLGLLVVAYGVAMAAYRRKLAYYTNNSIMATGVMAVVMMVSGLRSMWRSERPVRGRCRRRGACSSSFLYWPVRAGGLGVGVGIGRDVAPTRARKTSSRLDRFSTYSTLAGGSSALSSARVPSTMMRPRWRMAIRSASCSASSRYCVVSGPALSQRRLSAAEIGDGGQGGLPLGELLVECGSDGSCAAALARRECPGGALRLVAMQRVAERRSARDVGPSTGVDTR
jgi:hypothetical protein